jgi:hypothetical protein
MRPSLLKIAKPRPGFFRFVRLGATRRTSVALFFLASTILVPNSCLADPISFRFSGTITTKFLGGAPWLAPVAIGDHFVGLLTFDADAPDLDNVLNNHFFKPTLFRFEVRFPSAALIDPSDSMWLLTDDCPGNPCLLYPDSGDFQADFMELNFAIKEDPFHRGVFMQFRTLEPERDIVSFGEQIPTDPATYMTFPSRILGFSGINEFTLGNLETWERVPTPEPVPEPATIVLFGTAATMIGRRVWRQRRTG